MNPIKRGSVHVLPLTIKNCQFLCGYHKLPLSGTEVMAPSTQVFVQVALLFCMVTTSIGGITDWEKVLLQLENKVNAQQEEIMSLHQMIEQLEKRLEPLEAKGEFGEIQIQPAVPTLHAC